MAPRSPDPELAVYRLKWQKIFDALVQILNSRDSQLRILLKERKLLEDRIKTQLRVHGSDVAFLEDRISQVQLLILRNEEVGFTSLGLFMYGAFVTCSFYR